MSKASNGSQERERERGTRGSKGEAEVEGEVVLSERGENLLYSDLDLPVYIHEYLTH